MKIQDIAKYGIIACVLVSASAMGQDEKNNSSSNHIDSSAHTEQRSDLAHDENPTEPSTKLVRVFINPCNFSPSPSWCPNTTEPTAE